MNRAEIDWTHSDNISYYQDTRSKPSSDYVRGFSLKTNSKTVIRPSYDYILRTTLSKSGDEPLPGTYMVSYGGGGMYFETGVEYKVELRKSYSVIDTFIIKNEEGIFGYEGWIDFPVRTVNLGLFTAGQKIDLKLKIIPLVSTIDIDSIVGEPYCNLSCWNKAKKDGFDPPTTVWCNPPNVSLKATKCYEWVFTDNYTHSKYTRSYNSVKYVLSRAGGWFLTDGFSIDLYRQR